MKDGNMFYPNDITSQDAIDALEPWQLIVAACHFGPAMGDCRSLNYGYEKRDDALYCDGISLEGDIDEAGPVESLGRYAGFDWETWAKAKIAEWVLE